MPAYLTAERLDRLRRADAIVRRLSHESGFDRDDLAISGGADSVGHAAAARFGGAAADRFGGWHDRAARCGCPRTCWHKMVRELMEVEGVAGVFYDLTNKPPATIEWE